MLKSRLQQQFAPALEVVVLFGGSASNQNPVEDLEFLTALKANVRQSRTFTALSEFMNLAFEFGVARRLRGGCVPEIVEIRSGRYLIWVRVVFHVSIVHNSRTGVNYYSTGVFKRIGSHVYNSPSMIFPNRIFSPPLKSRHRPLFELLVLTMPTLCVVQLLPDSPNIARDTRDRSGHFGSCLESGRIVRLCRFILVLWNLGFEGWTVPSADRRRVEVSLYGERKYNLRT